MSALHADLYALPHRVWEQVRAHEDTLRRLARGGFDDLTLEQRRVRAREIVRLSAGAAVGVCAAPVPFLEVPVQAAMVRALAKVYGVPGGSRKVWLHMGLTMGGGLVLRRLLRIVPVAGSASVISRVYSATWALGHVAQLVLERQSGAQHLPAVRQDLRRTFDETMARKQAETEARLAELDVRRRLAALAALRDEGLLTAVEFQRRRDALLDEI
jgi:uncharacterized protein (DUF697 family)